MIFCNGCSTSGTDLIASIVNHLGKHRVSGSLVYSSLSLRLLETTPLIVCCEDVINTKNIAYLKLINFFKFDEAAFHDFQIGNLTNFSYLPSDWTRPDYWTGAVIKVWKQVGGEYLEVELSYKNDAIHGSLSL